jgi:hypothetical protein
MEEKIAMVHDRCSDSSAQASDVRGRTVMRILSGPRRIVRGSGSILVVGSSKSVLIRCATVDKGHDVGSSSLTRPFPARALVTSMIRAL